MLPSPSAIFVGCANVGAFYIVFCVLVKKNLNHIKALSFVRCSAVL